MRKITGLFLLILIMSACNNNGEQESTTVPTSADNKEKALQADVAKYPDSLLLKENLTQYYRDSGNYDAALKIVDATLAHDSLNARFWFIKGDLHFENEDTAKALFAYEKAVHLFPDPEWLSTLGSVYASIKDNRALSIAAALESLRNVKSEKTGLLIRGLYYSYTGDKKKAISFFDKSLALDYTFMLAYREKGIALYDLGKYEDALAVLNKAVTLQNNFDEGYYWMGRCLEKLNRNSEAIENYQAALSYSPDYVEAKDALTRLGVK